MTDQHVRPIIYIQAGAFSVYDNAVRLKRRLSTIARARIQRVTVQRRTMYLVKVGPATNSQDAARILHGVIAAGQHDAREVID
jgi:rare lipoprotein A